MAGRYEKDIGGFHFSANIITLYLLPVAIPVTKVLHYSMIIHRKFGTAVCNFFHKVIEDTSHAGFLSFHNPAKITIIYLFAFFMSFYPFSSQIDIFLSVPPHHLSHPTIYIITSLVTKYIHTSTLHYAREGQHIIL